MKFSTLTVLCASNDVMLCEMHEITKLLEYMTGRKVMTSHIPGALETCEPHLVRQHPVLEDPRITTLALGTLRESIQPEWDNETREKYVMGWAEKYIYPVAGRELNVQPVG